MSPLLAAQSLTCRFGDLVAVDDVSFTVEPGEVVGLLGANGAGKTTTLRMLLGLARPDSGQALLEGAPPNRRSRSRLGYVPQGLGLYAELTVRENLAFAAQAFRCQPATLSGPLARNADVLVSDLPLGIRRQLAFQCALQHQPAVLVLDEPTSGVEPLARARLWGQVREQSDRGVGVLVTTHYMQETHYCDRLLLMHDGRLVAGGTQTDIIGDTATVAVVGQDWQRIFEAVADAGLTVNLVGSAVRVVDPDLGLLRQVLATAGIAADLTVVPATLEERMASLASD